MQRHFTVTPTGGIKCVQCRFEFSTYEEFVKHCARGGRCKHPVIMGFHLDAKVSPTMWTSKKHKRATALPKVA